MRLYELFENMFIETFIFEMAYNKKVAIEKVRNLQNQIATHLVKIVIYPESENIQHWKNEVNAWLLSLQKNKLKGKDRPLSKELFIKLLFDEPLGAISDIQDEISMLEYTYPDMKASIYDPYEISSILSYAMLGVCEDMSKNKFKNISNYL